MKFRYRKYDIMALLTAMLILIGGTSCSDDAIIEGGRVDGPSSGFTGETDGVLLAFNLRMPSTRSETIPGGGSSGDHDGNHQTEAGTDAEGTISSFIITFYVYNTDNTVIVGPYRSNEGNNKVENNVITVEVSLDDMQKLAGNMVEVRVAANSNAPDTEDDTIFTIGSVDTYGSAGKTVAMANDKQFQVDLTALNPQSESFIQDLFKYLDEKRYWNLSEDKTVERDGVYWKGSGKLVLERGVARVDFKPKDADTEKGIAANTYQVGEIANLYVQLTDMQLINVKKDAFVFRHVIGGTASAANKSGAQIFGSENIDIDSDLLKEGQNNTTFNWIYDCDWTTHKNQYFEWASEANSTWQGPYLNGESLSKTKTDTPYFLNQPALENGYYVLPSTTPTTDKLFVKDLTDYSKHTPWCYMGENTLPDTASMIKGLTTGIAFNMFLCDKNGTPWTEAQVSTKFITIEEYNENQTAYENAYQAWYERKLEAEKKGEVFNETAPINDNDGKIVGSLKQKIGNLWELTVGSTTVPAYKRQVNLTQASDGSESDPTYAFVITYYYYFRHNISDNHILGEVEPMQFAVVRNNIYKINIASLNSLPEPYDPKDPDEPQENVIAVETAILSWAWVEQNEGSVEI